MKKSGARLFVALLLLFSIISAVFITSFALAQEPTTLGEQLQQQIGITPEQIEQIPTTPEEIRNEYLKQEWGKMLAKVPVIGPIHNFAVNNPLLFKIIFAEPYSFSPVFFMIFILWLFVAINATKFAKATGFINKNLCWIAGILAAIIIAQTKLYSFITNNVLAIILSKEVWWVRLIIWVVTIGVLVLVHYLGRMLSNSLKKNMEKRKQEKRISKVEQKAEVAEKFVKGAEEGIELAK